MHETPLRAKHARTIAIEIDHRTVTCPEGCSVLRAAELNGVFVPSLCSHKDLSPFGGCRLCVVEIEGMRGYPLACSTTVQEGMKVLSDSAALRDMRREILELILSEHPSSCLVCSEKGACQENQYTIRKAGVSTGCRTCPNDSACDLQSLVEKLGITDIHYPIYYRGYEAEHSDPFFDRDYNVCILCGRCVRMCQEVRGTAVLAFKYRGPKTQIGPAFGRNHVEAGCEFCGACVSVCPTGTLADKVSKWDGKPDGFAVSTCPFCALGCQIELHHKGGRLSKVLPQLDPVINDGQLCVRGRFCLPETTHHHERAKRPMLKKGKFTRFVGWAEAVEDVAAHLKAVDPEDFLMLAGPDLTNESLWAAQKFVRSGLGSGGIDSTARLALPGGVELWRDLFSLPVSIKAIADADSIIAVGLDSRFSFSVAGVEIRRALREGAALVTVDARESNLARYTEHWLRPSPGHEGAVFRALVDGLLGVKPGRAHRGAVGSVARAAIAHALEELAPGRDLAVVVGPTAFALDQHGELADALFRLAGRERTTFLPLLQGANTRGAVELGVLGEPTAGREPARRRGLSLDDLTSGRARPKVLYLVGETPFVERPDCDFVIAQDLYRPPFEVDAFLPAASFAEAGGTLVNIEGRVQEVVPVEKLPDGIGNGFVRPDWMIFGMLAARLGLEGFSWADSGQVLEEIASQVPGFPSVPDRQSRRLPARGGPRRKAAEPVAGPRSGYRLILEPGGFRHRGIDLASVVEGLGELGLEEGFSLHPDDLRDLGVAPGKSLVVSVDGVEVSGPVKADPECPRGAITFHRPSAWGGLATRRGFSPLHRLEASLHDATVRALEPTVNPAAPRRRPGRARAEA